MAQWAMTAQLAKWLVTTVEYCVYINIFFVSSVVL